MIFLSFLSEKNVTYLPRHFLLRHRESCEFAVWIVELTSQDMEPTLILRQILQSVSALICCNGSCRKN